jgi:group I intron endonuclease
MKSGIYLIKNIANNKVYVGSARNANQRWREHKHSLKKGKHHSSYLQRAWDKYGEQSFTFDIIEEVTNPEHLIAYEQVYLDYYKSYETDRGYNICKVAGSQLGMKHSEETKRKMSESAKNMSEETKKKMSEAKKVKN